MKPKIAIYWCASCGGCEEAVVDLAENILPVVEAVDIVFWPVAMDFKREDVEKMQDKEITVSFINGGVRTSEQKEMVELLRRKSKFVIAFGSCAHTGGIPGLANLWDKKTIFERAYKEVPSVDNSNGIYPEMKVKVKEGEVTLPEFWDTVLPLDKVIDVEYYLPGCPPTPKWIKAGIEALLSGKLPPKGSVIASDKSLCEECLRKDSKPDKVLIKELKRYGEVIPNTEDCLLLQGLICLGPATRGGCEGLCINANMPCTGCFGPLDMAGGDHGTRALAFLSSIIDLQDENDIKKVAEKVLDPLGIFYMYSLPSSYMERKIISRNGD